MNFRPLFLIIIGLAFNLSAFSQINLSAGYSFGYTDPEVNNNLISSLNEQNNDWLPESDYMEPLKGLHGLYLGLRYRYGPVGISTSWANKFQILSYSGEENVFNGTSFSKEDRFREFYYRINSLSAGLEIFGGRFSMGGTIDLNYLRIRSEKDGRDDRYNVVQSDALSSHFFVSFNVDGNDILSIAIQPYVQIPWTDFDLSDLSKELKIPIPDGSPAKDGFMNYGIRLIFHNGTYEN